MMMQSTMTGKEAPIFISGRQYSGNTMFSRVLGRHDDLYAFSGEGAFFERLPVMKTATGDALVETVAQQIAGGNLQIDDVREHIQRGVGRDPSPVDCYRAAKRGIARDHGRDRWVQKATSYVFYAPRIFEYFPEAQVLFLARNPLDLAASWKRRGHQDWWGRMLWGWNRGFRRAQRLQEQYPERFRILRYEDLVTAPTEVFREICSFCDLAYQEDCVRVPHVNRSETPYNQDSETRGIQSDRVFYFSDVLSSTESAAVKQLADAESLHRLYPDLPAVPEVPSHRSITEVAKIIAGGGIRLLRKQATELIAEPRRTWDRIKRRVS